MKLFLFLILSILVLIENVFAAGVCTVTLHQSYLSYNSQNVEVGVSCVGDSSTGTVPAIVIPFKEVADSDTVFNFTKGYSLADYFLYSIESIPVSSPVTAYTVTISNLNGTTLWTLAARSTTAKELAFVLTDIDCYPMITSPVTVQLGIIGASKRVDLRILFRAIKRIL
jgi:hypothetical protein